MQAGNAPLVVVERVRKRFGAARALDGIDLVLRCGETLGLLGPNGAGKTTLMHVLAGVTRPDEGAVRIVGFGDPIERKSRRAIGLAPQALALYPRLTARENLLFFGRIHGLRGRELAAQVAWGLYLADLSARADQRTQTFSGGMQRRLNLACAVLHKPKLLLLDEPTAGVDPQSRNRLFNTIESLNAGGATVVYSTHAMDEAERICSRVAILDRGRMLVDGAPDELEQRYGSPSLQTLFFTLTGTEQRD